MEQQDVIILYSELTSLNLHIWIDGGWGVDALLGKQTRHHKDLDIVIQQKDVEAFNRHLISSGYKEIKLDIAKSHNYVLGDKLNREVDVHVIVLDLQGNGIYGPEENNEYYPKESLSGKGKIGGVEVLCISPEYVIKFHSGYAMQEKDYHDVYAICKKFELDVPPGFLI